MDAMKRQGDLERAVRLFREALALNPTHEDSIYYLANCLEALGESEAALRQLQRLMELNPQSHRAYKRWGVLRAMSATRREELEEAKAVLERALAINPEETGVLLVLGEIALLERDWEGARRRFEWATRTNPKAVNGFYFLGYLAWQRGGCRPSPGVPQSGCGRAR
ncbi:MAG: hypothetical protein KatS3mg115_0265 [Candidatus Poribacteria bacterium]|nr:MAG: hypothetical protein KatS3mg115_0265 [Candidatus Poribacteria bacterium]